MDLLHHMSPGNPRVLLRRGWAAASLYLIGFLLILPVISSAETLVTGNIPENTIWTVSGSPYVVTGDVTVYHPVAGGVSIATLTIEPGVTVRFRPNTRLAVGHYNNFGALVARGTPEAPIIFTSDATTPQPGDWKGLCFDNATDDDTTVLEHCVVEYAGKTHNAGIYCSYASPTFRSCIIRNSSAHGIYLNSNANPVIGGEGAGNTITGNAAYGIYAANTASTPIITHNTISSNGSFPIRIGADKTVSDNSFSENNHQAIELIGGSISADTSWTDQGVPYIVTSDITVQQASLTVAPGVTVRFRPNTRLAVGHYNNFGALVARGTPEAPIIFTSDATTPQPGDWKGLCFDNATDDDTTVLEHCVVEYAGKTHNAGIYCSYASPTFRSCIIRNSSAHGIYLNSNANPVIGGEGAGNTITGNAAYGIYAANTASTPIITHNTISSNGSFPIRIGADKTVSDNSFSENNHQAIELIGGSISADTSWTDQGVPYIVTSDITVQQASLTVAPGVTVRFRPNTRLAVGHYNNFGALVARGTPEAPIIFTSDATTPQPGDWKGLYFDNATNDDATVLEHCVVEYAGKTHNAGIYCYYASPVIKSCILRNSSHSGIYLFGSGCDNIVLLFNTLAYNRYGVYASGRALPVIQNNNFIGNTLYGIYNDGASKINAEANWWGDLQGPNLSGDKIHGNAEPAPWLIGIIDEIIFPGTSEDSDGDDLPDSWENSHFGNLAPGSYDDPDNDGVPNFLEFLIGARPDAAEAIPCRLLDFQFNGTGRTAAVTFDN
ncbi:MAG: right-handed parallel beta-helix repeat-containing protein [Desulfobacterium sp.]|nr:right-handed parallel beta-helix repeat-containing protein [Desulfobacterium sp.]